MTPPLQCLEAKWECAWCRLPHAGIGNVVFQLLHRDDSLQQGTDWCVVLLRRPGDAWAGHTSR